MTATVDVDFNNQNAYGHVFARIDRVSQPVQTGEAVTAVDENELCDALVAHATDRLIYLRCDWDTMRPNNAWGFGGNP